MNTGMNLEDLRNEARSLGIAIDVTWSPQRLQREIEAKKSGQQAGSADENGADKTHQDSVGGANNTEADNGDDGQTANGDEGQKAESETPDPDGRRPDDHGTRVNVGSTAAPVYERHQ